MANRYMKRGSTSPAIRETQIKITQLDTRLKTTPQIYKNKQTKKVLVELQPIYNPTDNRGKWSKRKGTAPTVQVDNKTWNRPSTLHSFR